MTASGTGNNAEPGADLGTDAGTDTDHVVALAVGASVWASVARSSPTEPPIAAKSMVKHALSDAELSEAPPNEGARNTLGDMNTVPESRLVIPEIADLR